jgi:hypothetical protein
MLTQGLQNGGIDPNIKPKELWESHADFQKYPLSLFCLAFNPEKALAGHNTRPKGKLKKVLHLFLSQPVTNCSDTLCLVLFFILSSCPEHKYEDGKAGLGDDDDNKQKENVDGKPPAKKPRYNGNNNPSEEDPFQ